MDDRKQITTEMVRLAMKAFCQGAGEVSHRQLYEVLELNTEEEKDVVRSRANDLVRSGEINRTRPGVYTYNFTYRGRDCPAYRKIWKFIRMEGNGWKFADAAMQAHVTYSQVFKYCANLEKAKLIARDGKKGNTNYYRITPKGKNHPETPYFPVSQRNFFEDELAMAVRVATILLKRDPCQPKAASEIVTIAHNLINRFSEFCTQHENGGNTDV